MRRQCLWAYLVVACGTPATPQSGSEAESTTGPAVECAQYFDGMGRGCTSDPEACATGQAEVDAEFTWSFEFVKDGEDSPTAFADIDAYPQKVACVRDFFDAQGLAPLSDDYVGTNISARARASQVRALCEASIFDGCRVSATLERCPPFDEATCNADPFCWPEYGDRLNDDRTCADAQRVFATCLRKGSACSDLTGFYAGPSDRCWMTWSICIGDDSPGWSRDHDCPQQPDLYETPCP